MGYRHLSLCCKCGQTPSRIDEVGLTDDHELVIHWWCEECKRVVYASKSLAECWQDCPRSEQQAVPVERTAERTPGERTPVAQTPAQSRYDDRFLKSLGISVQDE